MHSLNDSDRPPIPPRRHARIYAVQGLCQWEVQPEEAEERFAEWLTLEEATPDVAAFAFTLIRAVWKETGRFDELIAQASTHWDLSRISPVERNIMRLALAEWLTGLTPPKVALNEAIEIGREFGGADSPRFVNGVLDEVFKRTTTEVNSEMGGCIRTGPDEQD